MPAAYPMVEEEDATGRVAAVYAAALAQGPFVPSLLKSLAVCPPYLVLAWEQCGPVLAASQMDEAVERLAASVEDAATPPAGRDDRELLAGFIPPLGRMLLLACGLLAAAGNRLGDVPPAPGRSPASPSGPLERSVPALDELEDHAAALGRLSAGLQTPIVNSIWRRLAAQGRLEPVWDELEPQLPATRAPAERLRLAATDLAAALPWEAAATPAALRAAGIEDARPGMEAVLRAYAETLARGLTLVACCRAGAGGTPA
jgi:hypothetical protein